MTRLFKFAWRRRRSLALLVAVLGAALYGFACAVNIDEGKRKHIIKTFNEVRRMPGRFLT